MKRIILILAVLAISSTLCAQSANVIEMAPADAVKAQAAWNRLQQAQKDWNMVKQKLGEQYTMVKHRDDPGSSGVSTLIYEASGTGVSGVFFGGTKTSTVCLNGACPGPSKEELAKQEVERQAYNDAHLRYYRIGFTDGFEFSSDFKYLVPKSPVEPHQNCSPFGLSTVCGAGY